LKKAIPILFWVSISLFIPTVLVYAQSIDSVRHQHYLDISRKMVQTALEDRKGYALLKELCEIGPRLSGSENSLRAMEWAKSTMEQLELEDIVLRPVMVPHWVRGDVEKAAIIGMDTPLAVAALGGSVNTPPDGISAKVLEIKSFDELEDKSDQAVGKIIFFNRPMDATKINTFAAYGGAVDQRVHGASYAAKYGGIGALVRSVTTRYDDVPHVGSMHYADSIEQVPAAAIGLVSADILSNALKENPDLEVKLELSCLTLPDAKSYNVMGEIKGTEKPKEIILISGHFDSWDKGDGAHDDGACCIQSLEVLDLFKRLNIKPKRTIRCVFFINEENGTRGARKYAQAADSSKTEIHVAAIEADRGAFTPRGFAVEGDSSMITYLNQWMPYLRQAKIDWIRKGGSGVDISKLNNCQLKIGYVPDNQRYFDYHHSDNDVFSAVHPREFELGSASMAILVYLLSEEFDFSKPNNTINEYTH